ncbi:right-handed parallel beta-helix repeat-containing protein [Agrilutibacter solisilvae]|uniref:Right-handed parallel beta-helix repeat-containing protein n=1 Tax=Agrilutibacter solisilvae TaxID=2763317 RepID=A0A974XZF8_9GAMM|nr:right-handed parallel beta-helix repeat-containing protein [Lysobacter solisilvae]QSX77780.1 right-handed parallel beta-helix repeat-containing protein [Lysobacter solisilvae]
MLLLGAGSSLSSPGILAAEGYSNCEGFIDSLPATITAQGVWCLRKDLNTAISAGTAIDIRANNVTIDCNDFKVGGLAGGAGTSAYGVRALSALNATVRNCTMRGFYVGAGLSGSGHVIEDNRFDANTYIGIEIAGDASVARHNLVVDTGGSTTVGGYAVGIKAGGAVDLIDNTVSGVVGHPNSSGIALAYGISTHHLSGSIAGNRVGGLVPSGTGTVHGINNQENGRISIRANDVTGNGGAGTGIFCTFPRGSALGNVISGFSTGLSGCTTQDNLIVP